MARHLTPAELAERWNTTTGKLANDRYYRRGPAWLELGRNTIRYELAAVEAYEAERRMAVSA